MYHNPAEKHDDELSAKLPRLEDLGIWLTLTHSLDIMNNRSFVYVSSQRPSYVCVNPLTLELIPEGRGVRIRLPQWKIDELVSDLSSQELESRWTGVGKELVRDWTGVTEECRCRSRGHIV